MVEAAEEACGLVALEEADGAGEGPARLEALNEVCARRRGIDLLGM